MKLDIKNEIEMPSGVTAALSNGVLTVKGPKGEVSRKFHDPSLTIKVEPNKVVISCKGASKREKRVANTLEAHVHNIVQGVQQPYKYVLKICSGHFPMNVSISGDQFIVKNFLGEKNPRTLRIKKGASVKVDGDRIVVESSDKDLAGQMSSDIELLTSKSNRDLRVFQDGIYMIEKAGEVLGASQ